MLRQAQHDMVEKWVPFAFRVWHTYGQIVRTPKANGTLWIACPLKANLLGP